jgi:hypothetical protein
MLFKTPEMFDVISQALSRVERPPEKRVFHSLRALEKVTSILFAILREYAWFLCIQGQREAPQDLGACQIMSPTGVSQQKAYVSLDDS